MTRAEIDSQIRRLAVVVHSRSGGPGGQNVNKVNTRVTLHVPLSELAPALGQGETELERAVRRLGKRVNRDGELVIHSSVTRSQQRNVERAIQRAAELIEEAFAPPVAPRRPTRPGKRARERRLEIKRATSRKKTLRRPPEE